MLIHHATVVTFDDSQPILDDGAAADNVIAGRVERIDVTGPAVRIYARTPFGIANARWPRKPGAPALSVGANLRLGFSATDCALFSDVAASGPVGSPPAHSATE